MFMSRVQSAGPAWSSITSEVLQHVFSLLLTGAGEAEGVKIKDFERACEGEAHPSAFLIDDDDDGLPLEEVEDDSEEDDDIDEAYDGRS